MENYGLQQVTVTKEALLEKLITNREQHAKDYAAAVAEYNKQFVTTLLNTVKQLDENSKEPLKLKWDLDCPRQYLDDYDRVINMLRMSIHANVTLTMQEFNQYVLDNWSWTNTFNCSTKSYLNKLA